MDSRLIVNGTAVSASAAAATPSTELISSGSYVRPPDYSSVQRPPAAAQAESESNAAATRPGGPRQSPHWCGGRCYVQKAGLRQHASFFFALSLASYVGVIVRIFLGQLKRWNGVPLFGAFYAEIVGTAIMGFVAAHKRVLQAHPAVYQGLATGLCGSITTFSSWNSEAAIVLLQLNNNTNSEAPDNATRVIGWATVILLGLGMPAAALAFGSHVAALSPLSDRRRPSSTEEEGEERRAVLSPRCRALEDAFILIAWLLASGLVVVLPLYFEQYDLLFSVAFATPGTYLRWHLAPLNAALSNFKLGTFAVNILGAWLLGGVLVVQSHFDDGALGAAALVGVVNGFCGCLTTVSTFAVELTSLPLRSAYLYGLLSLLTAQAGLVVILGSYFWSR